MIEPKICDQRKQDATLDQFTLEDPTRYTGTDIAKAAADAYCWKPMAALFSALALDAFLRTGVRGSGTVLDVGCGDGGFARLLQQTGIVSNPPLGMDLAATALIKAKRNHCYNGLLRADARRLPFSDACVSTVICCAMLESVPVGQNTALVEINRVLCSGGLFLTTLPTDEFVHLLPLPQYLTRVSGSLSKAYINRLEQRIGHRCVHSFENWRQRITQAGFEIAAETAFFSGQSARIWNLFSLQVFRSFSVLRPLSGRLPGRAMTTLMHPVLKSFVEKDPTSPGPRGYLLIVARKGQI